MSSIDSDVVTDFVEKDVKTILSQVEATKKELNQQIKQERELIRSKNTELVRCNDLLERKKGVIGTDSEKASLLKKRCEDIAQENETSELKKRQLSEECAKIEAQSGLLDQELLALTNTFCDSTRSEYLAYFGGRSN